MRKLGSIIIAALFIAMVTATAYAVPIIDFGTGTAGSGGTIIIGGGNASGSGIPVDTLTIVGTPSNSGTYDTSGAAIGSGATPGNPNSAELIFDTAANTISITGGIPTLGIANGTVLLTGSFAGFNLLAGNYTGSIEAWGPDRKAESLLVAVGLPVDYKFEFYGFSIGFNSLGGGSPYTAISTDILNIPEPASLVLIGSGLLFLYGFARKRTKKG